MAWSGLSTSGVCHNTSPLAGAFRQPSAAADQVRADAVQRLKEMLRGGAERLVMDMVQQVGLRAHGQPALYFLQMKIYSACIPTRRNGSSQQLSSGAWCQGMTQSRMETLPPGLSLPLRQAMQPCRSGPPPGESPVYRRLWHRPGRNAPVRCNVVVMASLI